MWILIIKLLYIKLEFYPEVEFQIWVQGNFIISVHAISGDVKLTLVEISLRSIEKLSIAHVK